MKTTLQVLVLASAMLTAAVSAQVLPPCDADVCDSAGDRCECASTTMLLNDMPQLVLLTTEGQLTQEAINAINGVTNGVGSNFDSCPLPFTFFVDVDGSTVPAAKVAFESHHELALSSFSKDAVYTGLEFNGALEEVSRARMWLVNAAGVPLNDVQGLRAPNMAPSTPMRQAMFSLGLSYDASEASQQPLNPYTMNFGIVDSDDATAKHAGLWQLTETLRNPDHTNADVLQEVLNETLRLRYDGNRAPLVLSFSPEWLTSHVNHTAGVAAFLAEVGEAFPDVRFVTATQAIRFVAKPQPVDQYQVACVDRSVFDPVVWREIGQFDLPTRSTTQGSGLGVDSGSSSSSSSSNTAPTPAPSSASNLHQASSASSVSISAASVAALLVVVLRALAA